MVNEAFFHDPVAVEQNSKEKALYYFADFIIHESSKTADIISSCMDIVLLH